MIDNFKPQHVKDNYKYYFCNGDKLPLYSDFQKMCEKLPNIYVGIHDSGMISTHNMPCCICKTNHAVFIMSEGTFEPCWKCQEMGYKIVKSKPKDDRGPINRFFDWIYGV